MLFQYTKINLYTTVAMIFPDKHVPVQLLQTDSLLKFLAVRIRILRQALANSQLKSKLANIRTHLTKLLMFMNIKRKV